LGERARWGGRVKPDEQASVGPRKGNAGDNAIWICPELMQLGKKETGEVSTAARNAGRRRPGRDTRGGLHG